MSRYRLRPTPTQEATRREHCAHARYVWNLAVERQSWWRPGRGHAPGYCVHAAQLTEARSAFGWLAEGSQMVQQQALRDFAQAMANFFAGTHRKPTSRKAKRHEGFRIVAVKPGHIRRLSRDTGQVWVPKAGWIRFRWSRAVPATTTDNPSRNVRQKAGLNRAILASGWGLLVRRLDDKAPGRVVRVSPAFTSQRCSACGQVAADSRESQALFRCIACGYTSNADVNAASNIAAGHAVTARGRPPLGERRNREPQPLPLSA
jgi:transposase